MVTLTDAGVMGDVAHTVQIKARVKSLTPGLQVTGALVSAQPLPCASVHIIQVHAHLQHLHLGEYGSEMRNVNIGETKTSYCLRFGSTKTGS